ncbi:MULTISPECIES: lysylphosphatidylglycerol synthase transmembrane domain-containing protein [Thermococcus]|uniref:lysylphosphatidylglycerol synthase transmembrane domain-containing protein n=1 Tax=Thermococcus TaxID=2263 RepID=UPI00064EBFFF|nr:MULTISPECIES: lysylphosphatidylglycerol synthase transmembrane domain-containing protein [Thermococcus]NJE03161.1 flippase-like domain-containing protein [Thermococcus sp. MV11]
MLESLTASAEQYFSVVSAASLRYLFLAFLTYYVSVVIYGIRWKLVLRGVGRDAPLWELVKAILASIFMNNVTPMSRSGGELLRMAWVSKRANIPAGVSAVSIIYERILETIPVFALFLLGMSYFSSDEPLPFLLFVVGGIALIWIKWDAFVRLSLRLFRTPITEEEMDRISSLRGMHNLNIIAIALSSAVWLLDVARLKLITLAFGLNLTWSFIALISIANLLFGLVAFTPGGVGIIEGGLIGTLTYFGIPTALAVSITLLERFVSYVASSIVGFAVLLSSGGVEIWKALKSQ